MFFSDDLLSSKKGSFGIIWLAATLGPKTKRITRKQLTGVDLTKTCELIAEPPEPLALRLSGCLLVGVARVYNQNYDLFYTDVTKFHSDLRRMVLSDFGAPIGPGGQPVGLDLAGDGKAKIDQITFGGEDASWLSNLNADFLNMRWNHPGFVSRDRQASTQLSSIHSQNTQESLDSEDESSESEDDDIISILADPENPRRKRKISKITTSSPGGKRIRPSIPFSSDPGDIPFNFEGEGLFPELFPDPYVPTSSPGGQIEFPPNFDPDLIFDPDLPIDGEEQVVDRESVDVNGVDVDTNGKAPPHGSLASLEEVDGLVEPEKKKRKAKKAKKVKFDDDLEIEYDALKDVSYAERMCEERAEMRSRERNKSVEDRATALVDGGGDWINFFDPEMKDFFATCSRPGKFQWESDHAVNGGPKYHEPKQDQVIDEIDVNQDPFGPDMTDPNATYIDPYHDYEVTVPLADDPEVPRGDRESQRTQPEAALPWADVAFSDNSDDFGLDNGFTPGSRLSNMTPLERRIRDSSRQRGIREIRSPSMLGDRTTDPEQLVSDENADDYDYNLDGEGFNPGNLPASQMRRELPEAFQPHMLASLEKQCRDFMTFTEKRMLQEEETEMDFDEIIEDDSTKKVAALAFYNCLTLATKKILSVSQPNPWESITLKFSAEV